MLSGNGEIEGLNKLEQDLGLRGGDWNWCLQIAHEDNLTSSLCDIF